MKRMYSSHSVWPSSIHNLDCSSIQFSEQQIIDLSSAFLTNGVHYITVNNVSQGRTLVTNLLKSLNFYHEVAYVGFDSMPHSYTTQPFIDVYSLFKDFLVTKPTGSIVEFLSSQVYCDFLWIEASEELSGLSSYDELEMALLELQFDKNMPIIVLMHS